MHELLLNSTDYRLYRNTGPLVLETHAPKSLMAYSHVTPTEVGIMFTCWLRETLRPLVPNDFNTKKLSLNCFLKWMDSTMAVEEKNVDFLLRQWRDIMLSTGGFTKNPRFSPI